MDRDIVARDIVQVCNHRLVVGVLVLVLHLHSLRSNYMPVIGVRAFIVDGETYSVGARPINRISRFRQDVAAIMGRSDVKLVTV